MLIGLNNGPVTNVASLVVGTGVNSNWSFNWVPPIAGSNTVVVKAVDLAGHDSLSVTSTFFYASYEALTLIVTNDVGTAVGATVTPSPAKWYATNGEPLIVGFTYGMKVTPTTG